MIDIGAIRIPFLWEDLIERYFFKPINSTTIRVFSYAIIWVIFGFLPEAAASVPISEKSIIELRHEFANLPTSGSSTRKRLALKRVLRKAKSLMKDALSATNGHEILANLLGGQMRLTVIRNTDENREELFNICTQLLKAPNRYAKIRLKADLLLLKRDLSNEDASIEDYSKALVERLYSYRDTEAEAQCLIDIVKIASKNGLPELKDKALNILKEKFPDDSGVIEFIRSLSMSKFKTWLKYEFPRLDGTVVRFPEDTTGHLCLVIFWSKGYQKIEGFFKEAKAYLAKHPKRFTIFSLNTDELADGGQSILKEHGFDWQILYLKGGKKHQAYRAYSRGDPVALLVSMYGHISLEPVLSFHGATDMRARQYRVDARIFRTTKGRLSSARHHSQLVDLFVGNFLVREALDTPFDPNSTPEHKMSSSLNSKNEDNEQSPKLITQIPLNKFQTIQDCFLQPPHIWRLSAKELLANYKKVGKLCDELIEKYPKDPGLWIIRNRKIVSLMGLWKTGCLPQYLELAAKEAKALLATDLPRGADVVSRFCLANEAIRNRKADPKELLSNLVDKAEGTTSALGAATILALQAMSQELHIEYRDRFLKSPDNNKANLWSFRSFCVSRFHQFYLPLRSHDFYERGSRYYAINHTDQQLNEPMLKLELKTLEGRKLTLPKDSKGRVTLLLFMEPPPGKNSNYPDGLEESYIYYPLLGRYGKPIQNDLMRSTIKYATDLAKLHVNKEVDVLMAFLSEDKKRIKTLMKENNWTCRAAMVPSGLSNPIVQRLGILSADRIPNVFLIRRDGIIAWKESGLAYNEPHLYASLLAMKVHIERSELEVAYQALSKGDNKRAVHLFTEPFVPAEPYRYRWRPVHYHGLAIAQMASENWLAALEAIDSAIDAHRFLHYGETVRWKQYCRLRVHKWREAVAEYTMEKPCDTLTQMRQTKVVILKKLNRKKELAAIQKFLSTQVPSTDDSNIYKSFHGRLNKWRLDKGLVYEHTQTSLPVEKTAQ